MTNTIDILGNEVSIKEYNGQRVVTFKDIDAVHGRKDGTAHRNFKANRNRFIEGVDYLRLQKDEIRPFGITSPNGGIVLTESGYLMLAKSFTDDLAWEVQRCLVNTYFKAKELVKGMNQNPCAYAQAKDRIALWKRHVSNPLIERLQTLLCSETTLIETYAYIYKDMKKEYGFDMNEEKFKYSQKYHLPYGECSVIDVIADNRELRYAFVWCANKNIKNKAKARLEEAKQFSKRCNEILKDIDKYSSQFEKEMECILGMVDCNCLG